MQPSAWAFMILVWTLVIGSVSYCFWRLLTSKIQLGNPNEEGASTDDSPDT